MGVFTTQEKLELTQVEDRVRAILDEFPVARNCDKRLQEIYLREFNNVVTFVDYVNNHNCTSLESIRRARQKIQAKGKLMPTDPKVLKERFKLAPGYKDHTLS